MDRNLAFVIISIVVLYSVERCIKNIHGDLITPTFQKCLCKLGWNVNVIQERPVWQRVLFHLLELCFTLLMAYFISKYVFGHGRVSTATSSGTAVNRPVTPSDALVNTITSCGKTQSTSSTSNTFDTCESGRSDVQVIHVHLRCVDCHRGVESPFTPPSFDNGVTSQ